MELILNINLRDIILQLGAIETLVIEVEAFLQSVHLGLFGCKVVHLKDPSVWTGGGVPAFHVETRRLGQGGPLSAVVALGVLGDAGWKHAQLFHPFDLLLAFVLPIPHIIGGRTILQAL